MFWDVVYRSLRGALIKVLHKPTTQCMQVAMGWVGLQQDCKVVCNVLLHGGRHLGRAVAIVGVGSNIGVGHWCWPVCVNSP